MFRLEIVIGAISNLSVFLPITFYLLNLKKVPKSSHIIGMLLITSLIFDAVGYVRFSNKQSTVVLFNVYYLLQYLMLSAFFYKILFKESKQFFFKVGTAVFIVSYFCILFTVQDINEYQSYVWTAGSVILASYGFMYTNHQLKNPALFDRHFKSTLFINGAIVVYFSFSFLLYIVDQYLLSSNPEIVGSTWNFHNVNNIVKNIALAIGLYYTGKSNTGLTKEEAEALKEKYPGIKMD